MSFRSLASLRVAVSLAAFLVLSACSDGRQAPLSAVGTIDVPVANAGTQANQNISNPTLEIPVTYPVGEGDELTLVWSEEFDGPEIDPGTWFFATGDGSEVGLPGGWGNNELQYYLPDNAMIVNGVLEITARRETVGELNYTSARINTQDRFAFKYGRIEASMKLPGGQGLWPAFWMLSQDSDYLCSGDPCVWAAIGEIDIVEAVNLGGTGGNEIFATIHYGDEFPANQSTETRFTPSVDVTETFNTYALEWDEDEIRWYLNGELYASQPSSVWFSAADNAGPNGPFDQNFHILLNLAVGGNFPGSPNGTTPWPVTMEVDWVRVYSGEPPPADAGDVPENAVFVTDPNVTADLAAPILDNFGSGATFNAFFAGDPDFKPTLQVTSGNAYEGNPDVGFVAFAGYDAGFAADYQTFSFKVKGLPGDELEIKFFGSPENSIIINLGTYAGATELGNGWYQVTVPMSDFAANVYAFTGFLIGPPGDQGAPFSFLLTDIGFNGSVVTAPADAGTTPDVTLYARGGATDLVFGEDYTAVEVFGSGAIANNNNTGDVDFSPAFSVTTGNGYTVQVGQLAFLGFGTGFAADYLTLDFKVKGMNNDIIRLKLLEAAPSDYVDITLTSSDFATDLGNGWYQVSVSLETFGNVETADGLLFETGGEPPAGAFTFLLNDIGFSGTIVVADPGIIPDDVIYATDPGEVVDLVTTITAFGTSSAFEGAYALDADFNPVFEAQSGSGYGLDNILQLGFVGLAAGFATGYESFAFKMKSADLPGDAIEVKLEGGGTCGVVTLTDPTYSTPLGNGWYQVVLPVSNCAGVATAVGVLFERVGAQNGDGGTPFSFLVTDIGFSNAGADAGIIPDDVIYATDPGEAVDLVTTITAFGTSSAFEGAYALDLDFNPVFEAQSGSGYGLDNIVQLGFVGLAAGFATGYESFAFKMKSADLPGDTIEVKLEGGGSCGLVVLTDPTYSTPLGNGWYQVVLPVSNCAGVATAVGVLFERVGAQNGDGGTPFSFLVTDIGFNNAGADAGIIPDDVIYATDPGEAVDLVTTITAFGTSSAFEGAYALDADFNPAFEAQSGSGYGLDNIVQLGFVGLAAGFATGYESFAFKMKSADLPGDTIEVKLEGGGSCGLVLLTDPTYSTPLGNGWYQVVLPVSNCAGVATAVGVLFERVGAQNGDGGTPFSFLVTDIGFNNAGADAGIIPDDVIYATDPGEAVDLATTITAFGTSSAFEGAYALDADFNPAFEAQSGSGYGLDNIVQLGFVGLAAGFATGYESFAFKMKSADLPGDTIEVKLEGGGSCGLVVLTDPTYSTPLGNGWYQVVLPVSNCAGVATAVGVLFERVGAQNGDGGTPFSFLVTDIGFNNAGADAGIIPDDVIYATDPGEAVDLATTITAFGTSSAFEGAYALDVDFNPAFEAQSGSGYGLDNIVQLGFVGLAAGFATGYESFAFKMKSADLPGDAIEVKLEGGATCGVVTLTDPTYSTPLGSGWYQVVLPVSNCGGVATAVGVLFERVGAQNGDGGTPFSFLVTDIGFNNPTGGVGSELASNGNFEAGTFDGWQQAIGSGLQSISGDTPTDGGSFSAALSGNTAVGAGGTTEIKQANLGSGGALSVGDVLTIRFQVKGTFGPGGQLNVLSFTEFGGGGADLSNNTTIAGGVDGWTQYDYDVTLSGADASGGFSLAFNPVCGAVAGCFADVFIDNVSITTN